MEVRLAEITARTGFADQSHSSGWMRHALGVSSPQLGRRSPAMQRRDLAQIPACGMPVRGSHLGWQTAKRWLGQDG